MTTYYVSNAASNGYVVGNDANDGLGKSTPWLTVMKAHTAAATGDTVYLNAGTYLSSDGASGGTSFAFTKGIAWISETALGAVLTATATGAGSAVVTINLGASVSMSMTDIDVDATSTQHRCLSRGNAQAGNVITLTRCRWKSALNIAVREPSGVQAKWVITDCIAIMSPTQTGSAVFDAAAGTVIDVTISGLAITFVSSAGSATSDFGLNIRSTTGRTSAAVSITGVTGSITSSAVAASQVFGIFIQSITGAIVQDCNFSVTLTAGATDVYGIKTRALNSLDCNNCIIRRNTITLNGTAGYGVQIGNPTSGASDNLCEGALVYQNTVTGNSSGVNTPHAFAFNYQATGECYRNISTQMEPAVVWQRMSGGRIWGNIFKNPYNNNGAILVKGCSGGAAYNNTIYLNAASYGVRVKVGDDATNTSVFAFTNNLIYSVAVTAFVTVDVSQVATFRNNLYYSVAALPAACFAYQASTYDTVAAWVAARETSGLSGDPKLYDPGNSDFRLNIGSAAVAAGTPVMGVKDYTGKRYNPSRPDVGAYVGQLAQTRSSASARTARS